MAGRLQSSQKLVENKVLSDWCSEQGHLVKSVPAVSNWSTQPRHPQLDETSTVQDESDEVPRVSSISRDGTSERLSSQSGMLFLRFPSQLS
jgi:hypothetical protein